jgi:hypothetical protein
LMFQGHRRRDFIRSPSGEAIPAACAKNTGF